MNITKFALSDLINYQVAFISLKGYFEIPCYHTYGYSEFQFYNNGPLCPYIKEDSRTHVHRAVVSPIQTVVVTVYDPAFNRASLDTSGESPDNNTHDVTVYLAIPIATAMDTLGNYINNNQYLMNHKWFNSPFFPFFSASTWLSSYGEAKTWFNFTGQGFGDAPVTLGQFLTDMGYPNLNVAGYAQHWEWNGTSIDGGTVDYVAGIVSSSLGYGIGFNNNPLSTYQTNPFFTGSGSNNPNTDPATGLFRGNDGGSLVSGGGESQYQPPTLSGANAPLPIGPVAMNADLSAFTTSVKFNLLKSTTSSYDAVSNTTTITDTIKLYPRPIYLSSIDIIDSPIGNGYASVTINDSVFSDPTPVLYQTWYTLRTTAPVNITGVLANLVYNPEYSYGSLVSATTGYAITLTVVMNDATHPNMALRYNFIDPEGNSFSYVSSDPLVEVDVGSLNSKYQLGIQVPIVKDASGAVIPDYYGTKTTQGTNTFLSNLVYVGYGHGPV